MPKLTLNLPYKIGTKVIFLQALVHKYFVNDYKTVAEIKLTIRSQRGVEK